MSHDADNHGRKQNSFHVLVHNSTTGMPGCRCGLDSVVCLNSHTVGNTWLAPTTEHPLLAHTVLLRGLSDATIAAHFSVQAFPEAAH